MEDIQSKLLKKSSKKKTEQFGKSISFLAIALIV
ncbi:MAG: phosphate ABC transporter permease subunit PstC, partial [Vagococcus sp.]